ncbi:MAG: GTPase domain-containing protein [Pseudomonadota bacterium]
MAYVDLKNRVVQAKIVYYGPGRGGKTTNLEYIYKIFRDKIKTEMISIKTHGDRTLFFDFFPLEAGKIKNFDVQIQLYTAPGQVKYNETKKLVLRGVDGIVFVADSLALREEKNILALKNLQENLVYHKKNIFKIPLVFQYNKRDLEEKGIPLLSTQAMEKKLNSKLKAPSFEASAAKGVNVVATLKTIISLTVNTFQREVGLAVNE